MKIKIKQNSHELKLHLCKNAKNSKNWKVSFSLIYATMVKTLRWLSTSSYEPFVYLFICCELSISILYPNVNTFPLLLRTANYPFLTCCLIWFFECLNDLRWHAIIYNPDRISNCHVQQITDMSLDVKSNGRNTEKKTYV